MSHRTAFVVSFFVCAFACTFAAPSCSAPASTTRASVPWSDAEAGVADQELARLCRDAWEDQMQSAPVGATYLGDPRYHGKLDDNSLAGTQHRAETLRAFVWRAEALNALQLNATDRVTLELLYQEWKIELEEFELGIDGASWNLDARGGPQTDFLSLASDQPVATAREREQLVERWKNMALYVDRAGTNLRRGLAAGRVSSRHAARAVLDELDELLATPIEKSPLCAPALGGGTLVTIASPAALADFAREQQRSLTELSAANTERFEARARARERFDHPASAAAERIAIFVPSPEDALLAAERGRFVYAVENVLRDELYPAFKRYRDLISGDVLPRTRDDEHAGVGNVRDGARYYRLCIRRQTSLDLTPEEIHAYGLQEVARIRAQISELGQKVFATGDVARIQQRLRGDPALHFANAAEIMDKARSTLARAQAAVPRAFGIQPKAACEVIEIPAHEAAHTTVAYYREPTAPHVQPARAGRYYVNVSEPRTRTRYEAEVLAFHEAVPGHHLQIAIAQELAGLPLVRRHNGSTAFVEGWALYTERLADELGLYSSDVDRLGMLSYDAWRSCRLVVDTGIHALGWTRAQAIEYMTENTLLAPNNIENEVDRYIAWPGQALAYKLGQREILALRARARERMGADFKLQDFHDRVLENGAVNLSVLREAIERWIDAHTRTAMQPSSATRLPAPAGT